jgi:hypothetical protein
VLIQVNDEQLNTLTNSCIAFELTTKPKSFISGIKWTAKSRVIRIQF